MMNTYAVPGCALRRIGNPGCALGRIENPWWGCAKVLLLFPLNESGRIELD